MPIDKQAESWLKHAEYKAGTTVSPLGINDRSVTGIASVFGVVDNGNDVIHPGAFKKTLAESKSKGSSSTKAVYLWNHDLKQVPIAKILEIREIPRGELPESIRENYPEATGGLLVTREYLDTPRGNEVLEAVKSGALTQLSIGYNVIQKDYQKTPAGQVRNLRELRLLDLSDVSFAMNQATVSMKGAIPFSETPLAPKDTEWDGPNEKSESSTDDLKAMCAWYDSDNPDVKSSYKLPHHEAKADHAAVWRGVSAAMGALMGAQGGVDIPDEDRRAVYEHLAKHYAEFDEEPPEFKWIELAGYMAKFSDGDLELKAGRRNSAEDEAQMRALVAKLQDSLSSLASLLGDPTVDPNYDPDSDGDDDDDDDDDDDGSAGVVGDTDDANLENSTANFDDDVLSEWALDDSDNPDLYGDPALVTSFGGSTASGAEPVGSYDNTPRAVVVNNSKSALLKMRLAIAQMDT